MMRLQMAFPEMPEVRVNGSSSEEFDGLAAPVVAAPAEVEDGGQALAVAASGRAEVPAIERSPAPMVEAPSSDDQPVTPSPGSGVLAAAPVPVGLLAEPVWCVWLRWLAVVAVAVAAAIASTEHLAEVARLAGTEGFKVWLLPVSVDGLAVAAGLVLYRAHRLDQSPGPVPWVCELVALAASVSGNVVAVYPELVGVAVLKVAVGAVPPLALVAALKLALAQGAAVSGGVR